MNMDPVQVNELWGIAILFAAVFVGWALGAAIVQVILRCRR